MRWYEYYPADTLFLRGSEPMEAGNDFATDTLFPPPVSVISGAVRTAVLAQKNISIKDYRNGDSIKDLIGEYGKEAEFKIIGPILKRVKGGKSFFVPAPYTWFTENRKTEINIKIKVSTSLNNEVIENLGLKTSAGKPYWVKHNKEVKSIGGTWISLDSLIKKEKELRNNNTILFSPESQPYGIEPRIGIAIDENRVVKESQLYSAKHIRLKQGYSLVWAIDKDCDLKKEGVLSLGGEQRFGKYNELEKLPELPKEGTQFLALSPIAVDKDSKEALIATGKIIYRGGWDLAKQFHKDMVALYPAGTVFNKNINNSCINF